MNRRNFLYRFGLGAAVVAVAPSVLADIPLPPPMMEAPVIVNRNVRIAGGLQHFIRTYNPRTAETAAIGTSQSFLDFVGDWKELNASPS